MVTNSLIRRNFSVHLIGVFVRVSSCRGGSRKRRKHLLGALSLQEHGAENASVGFRGKPP